MLCCFFLQVLYSTAAHFRLQLCPVFIQRLDNKFGRWKIGNWVENGQILIKTIKIDLWNWKKNSQNRIKKGQISIKTIEIKSKMVKIIQFFKKLPLELEKWLKLNLNLKIDLWNWKK